MGWEEGMAHSYVIYFRIGRPRRDRYAAARDLRAEQKVLLGRYSCYPPTPPTILMAPGKHQILYVT